MSRRQMDEMDWLRGQGRYLRRVPQEPQHACSLPTDAEGGDVFECGCGRVYIFSNAAGYGFEWRRVIFRKWWFQFKAGVQEARARR